VRHKSMPKAAGVKANIPGQILRGGAQNAMSARRFRGYMHHSLCDDDGSITVPFPDPRFAELVSKVGLP
jgi:hypothetical protein